MRKEEGYVSEKEFDSLSITKKWGYVSSLHKLIGELKIQAEKNCGDCQVETLDVHDLNIDFAFEDWRECANHCDECGKEERVNMCQLQFDILNLIANSVATLRSKHNSLYNLIIRKDDYGKKILEKFEAEAKKDEETSADMFL